MDNADLVTIRPLLKQYVELCLIVNRAQKVSPSPQSVLHRLVSSIELSAMEWCPVLGPHGLLHGEDRLRVSALQVRRN